MEVEICERDSTINQTMTTGALGDGWAAGNLAAGVVLPRSRRKMVFYLKKMLILQVFNNRTNVLTCCIKSLISLFFILFFSTYSV